MRSLWCLATLGCLWAQFYERQTMAVLMRGLESAFGYFGGVPSELLFDQMKAVIVPDNREIGGRVIENPDFFVLPPTGGSRSGHAERIGPRPRARSSGRSATSARTSSTDGTSSRTPI